MATDIRDKAEVERRLWREVERRRIGMLGPVGWEVVQHFQPMTAFAEPESNSLWFYTRSDTALARASEPGVNAMFVLMADDMQACIGGELKLRWDSLHRDKYWNAAVAAWYPQGKDDPELAMMRLACHDAQVWLNEAGPMKFGWEIAKANLVGSEPHLGSSTNLRLD